MNHNKDTIGEELSEFDFTDFPNEKYKKFFDKFKEINSLDVKSWKPIHILAYFCRKYEKQYGLKYKFKYNTESPTNCFEIFNIKKLSLLLSKNPETLVEYIDWAFENKIKSSKRRITSISFINSDEFLNTYKSSLFVPKEGLNIKRSIQLPNSYSSLFEQIAPIKTYGDLAFMYQSFKSGVLDESISNKFSLALNDAVSKGFDVSLLSRVV